MALHDPTRRRVAALCTALAVPLALPVALATPAAAQTGGSDLSGATRASALTLTLNLPQATRVQLVLDPVSGTVRSVTGSAPEAQAVADLIAGSIAGQAQSFGRAEARLPAPTSAAGPTDPFDAAVAGTPLAEFLSIRLLDSSAEVATAPSSTSQAQIASVGVGLPAALLESLAPALDPVRAGVSQVLTALAGGAASTQTLCDTLTPVGAVTQPVVDGVAGIPVIGTVVDELVGDADEGEIAVLCELDEILTELDAELAQSLGTLAGPGGVLGTGLITAQQSVVHEGTRTTATATASIADLTVLGTSPFVGVDALETTSTAVVDGTTATATVDQTAVNALANPVLTLVTDLQSLTGELLGVDLEGVDELATELQALLEALAGIGIEAGPLTGAGDAIEACPTALDGGLSGTFQSPDGRCAAAASRGYGLAVTLPAALAGPLGIEGPLVELALVPTAAVAQAQPVATLGTTPPAASPRSLPRTGPEAPLAVAGAALLLGAAALRRRRSAAAA
jgi:hypothetical protein